jgi:endonuclease/exonuclease/phosphatase family metal-dependent hydrolase
VVAGNTSASGPTFVSDNNFYEDDDDNPHQNHRLDYVLMKAGLKCIPILASIDILKFKRDGRFISDHFGLLSRFDHAFKIEF